MVAAPAAFRLVPGGIDDSPAVEHKCDVLLAVALQRPLKDLPHHFRRFRLDNKMVFVLRVLLIAVNGKSADVLPLPPLHVENHAYVLGKVL